MLLLRLPDAQQVHQHQQQASTPLCSLNLPLLQVDMNSARAKELAFFKANPRYADLKNVGMGHLAGHLSGHLITAIRKQLPQISHSINTGGLLVDSGCQSQPMLFEHLRLAPYAWLLKACHWGAIDTQSTQIRHLSVRWPGCKSW